MIMRLETGEMPVERGSVGDGDVDDEDDEDDDVNGNWLGLRI